VEIEVGRASNVLLVPRGAVRNTKRGDSVMVAGVGRRLVQLGLADDRYVEVRSGLQEDEQVLLPGASVAIGARERGAQQQRNGRSGQASARRMQRVIGGGGR